MTSHFLDNIQFEASGFSLRSLLFPCNVERIEDKILAHELNQFVNPGVLL